MMYTLVNLIYKTFLFLNILKLGLFLITNRVKTFLTAKNMLRNTFVVEPTKVCTSLINKIETINQ